MSARLRVVRSILALCKRLPASGELDAIEAAAGSLQRQYVEKGDREISFRVARSPIVVSIVDNKVNVAAGERQPIHCFDAKSVVIMRVRESSWEVTVTSPGGTTFMLTTKEPPVLPTQEHSVISYFDLIEEGGPKE